VAKNVPLVHLISFELSKLVKILNWWSKFKMAKTLVWQLWPSANQALKPPGRGLVRLSLAINLHPDAKRVICACAHERERAGLEKTESF
jgi:hypothetical protein